MRGFLVSATLMAFILSFSQESSAGTVAFDTTDKTSCFPVELTNTLHFISEFFNSKVIILSGHRSREDNRLRGGSENSRHIHCKAADFRVEGVSRDDVAALLATLDGGKGFYCNERFHIDVDYSRQWGKCPPKPNKVAQMQARVQDFKRSKSSLAWNMKLKADTEIITPKVNRPNLAQDTGLPEVVPQEYSRLIKNRRPYVRFHTPRSPLPVLYTSHPNRIKEKKQKQERWRETIRRLSRPDGGGASN